MPPAQLAQLLRAAAVYAAGGLKALEKRGGAAARLLLGADAVALMAYFVAGVALLVVLLLLGRAFVAADPRTLVRYAPLSSLASLLIAFGGVLIARASAGSSACR